MMIGSVTAIRNDSMVRLSKGKMLQLCDNLIAAKEKTRYEGTDRNNEPLQGEAFRGFIGRI